MNPLLWLEDEPVRHVLDLIGDLALVGFPQAQVLHRDPMVFTPISQPLCD